jgi:hypothetical protein
MMWEPGTRDLYWSKFQLYMHFCADLVCLSEWTHFSLHWVMQKRFPLWLCHKRNFFPLWWNEFPLDQVNADSECGRSTIRRGLTPRGNISAITQCTGKSFQRWLSIRGSHFRAARISALTQSKLNALLKHSKNVWDVYVPVHAEIISALTNQRGYTAESKT